MHRFWRFPISSIKPTPLILRLALLTLITATASAQESLTPPPEVTPEVTPPPKVTPEVVPETPKAPETPKSPAPKAKPKPGPEQLPRHKEIYLPFNKLNELFEIKGRGVFLPKAEFEALWKAAQKTMKERKPVQQLRAAHILATRQSATIQGEVMRIESEMDIELIGKGWHQVPIPWSRGSMIKAALKAGPDSQDSQDEKARVLINARGDYYWMHEKKTDAPELLTLQVTVAKAYQRSPGQNVVQFQIPQSPMSRWMITIPEKDVKIQVSPLVAGHLDKNEENENRTQLLAYTGQSKSITIRWTPKAEGAKGLDVITDVTLEQRISIDKNVQRNSALLIYQVKRSKLDKLTLELPASEKIVSVSDSNIRQWSVKKAENDRQQIDIQLFEAVSGTQRIKLETENYLDAEKLELAGAKTKSLPHLILKLPDVIAIGAARQQGTLLLFKDRELNLDVEQIKGLVKFDYQSLPPSLLIGRNSTYISHAFRFNHMPYELSVKASPIEPRLKAWQLTDVSLTDKSLAMHHQVRVNIEKAGLFQMKFELPENLELEQVRMLRPGSFLDRHTIDTITEDGKETRQVTLQFSRKLTGPVDLSFSLLRKLPDEALSKPGEAPIDIAFDLPRLLPATAMQPIVSVDGGIIIHSIPSLNITPDQKLAVISASVQDAIAGAKVFASKPHSPHQSDLRRLSPFFAYTHQGENTSISLKASRRAPYVTVYQRLSTHLEPGKLKGQLLVTVNINYSPIPTIDLKLPDRLKGLIRSSSRLHDQWIEPDPKTPNTAGTAIMRFTGESELIGEQILELNWEEPLDQLSVGQSREIDIPSFQIDQANYEWGQIVMAKDANLDIKAIYHDDKTSGLRPIDPRHDLNQFSQRYRVMTQAKDPAKAYEFRGPWQLKIKATHYELEQVKRTSIERAYLRHVLSRSDIQSVQALYRIRSARQRLAVILPDNVSFDTQPVRINGRLSRLEKGTLKQLMSESESDSGSNSNTETGSAAESTSKASSESTSGGTSRATSGATSGGGGGFSADQVVYYIPLTGQTPNQPFLLEIKYNVPEAFAEISLPIFPEMPAQQKVMHMAYVPEEYTFLGYKGEWADQIEWQTMQGKKRPLPRLSDASLLQWVSEGISLPTSVDGGFQVDGSPLLFSALNPSLANRHLSLRLSKEKWLNTWTFLLLFIAGLGLLMVTPAQRMAALLLSITLLCALGTFAPIFFTQITTSSFYVCVVIIIFIWAAWHVAWVRPRDPLLQARKAARLAHLLKQSKEATEAPPPTPSHSPEAPEAPETPEVPEAREDSEEPEAQLPVRPGPPAESEAKDDDANNEDDSARKRGDDHA